MKIKDILAMVTVALMTVGCSSIDEAQQEGRVPILLKAVVEGAATGQTRTPAATIATTQDTEFLPDELVDAYIFLSDGSTPLASGTNPGTAPLKLNATGTVGDLTPVSNTEPKYYYPTNGSAVNIYAVHPSVASGDFSVETDQTTEDKYAMSDLCYSATDTYTRQTGSQTLIFNHVLSKIVVKITTNITGATLPTAVKLMACKTTTFTYPTGTAPDYTLAATASDPATITMAMTTADGTATGAAVIPPQTIAADASFLAFSVPGVGPMVYPMPAATTFESGKRYTYNIHVDNVGITATTNVSPWGDGGSQIVAGKKAAHPKLPIEYVADYNMQTATAMATDNLKSHSGYFSYNTSTAGSNGVSSGPKANIQAMINGTAVAGYHLPTKAEWCSVVAPYYAGSDDSEMGGSNKQRIYYKIGQNLNLSETVAWGVANYNGTYSYEVNQVFYNDYNCPNDAAHTYIGYGLRFKEKEGSNYVNGQYTCAYRYEYKSADASVGGGASLTINVIYVGANSAITISTISDESWWASPEYTVVLPAGGYSPYANGSDQAAGWSSPSLVTSGYYWTVTPKNASFVYDLYFDATDVCGNGACEPGRGLFVRMFKDTDDPGVVLANSTIGMVVANNGLAYESKAIAESYYHTVVAVVGYKSGSSGYAVALVDATSQSWNSVTSNGTYRNQNCTLADNMRGDLPVAPSGTTWKVLTKDNYSNMFYAMGSTIASNNLYLYDNNVNNIITAAGGTGFDNQYWSTSDTSDAKWGWTFMNTTSNALWGNGGGKPGVLKIRPVLAW